MYLKYNIDGPQENILYKNENDLEIFLNGLKENNIHYEIVGKQDDGIEIKIIFENEEEKNQFEEENKENDKIKFLNYKSSGNCKLISIFIILELLIFKLK